MGLNDVNSISQMKQNCKYHIVYSDCAKAQKKSDFHRKESGNRENTKTTVNGKA